jgi:hypothetical protein
LVQAATEGAGSYLDALRNYDSATQEAIALARRRRGDPGVNRTEPRDLDLDALPEPDAVRAVMLHWHRSLLAVLKSGEQLFQHPLDLMTEDVEDVAEKTGEP